MKRNYRPHRLINGFTDSGKLKRGFIPKGIKSTDGADEIMDIYGVSYSTARLWIRILNGPKFMP